MPEEKRSNDEACSPAKKPKTAASVDAAGARIISGTKVAKTVRAELAEEVNALKATMGKVPHLAVILVGARKDSQTYVRMKTKACKEVGLESTQYDLPAEATQEQIEELITRLNNDTAVNGLMTQLPLPSHIDTEKVLGLIDPRKDVDGLHQTNNGDLFRVGTKAQLIPCTPLGCIRLLDSANIPIEGARAVVIGRSALVGKPLAMLLLSRNATVTMCHSRTKDLASHLKEADIVCAAIGKPKFVKAEWLKPGCTVIDVGINAVDDVSKKRGYYLAGDVDTKEAKKVCGAITPVPGGVGPMTVAMLLSNTVSAFKLQNKVPETG